MPDTSLTVLVAILDADFRDTVLSRLTSEGCLVVSVNSFENSSDSELTTRPEIAIADFEMIDKTRDLVDRFGVIDAGMIRVPVLGVVRTSGGNKILEALRRGADDFLESRDADEIVERTMALVARKQAGSLINDDDYFRLLVDSVSDIISILSLDGTILFESASVEQVLGHKQTDIIGRNAFELIHPDDRARVQEYFYENACKFGQSLTPIDYLYIDQKGNWRTLESVGKIVNHPRKGLIAVVTSRDVTKARADEEALRKSEETFRHVLENSLDIIYQINVKTGQFDYASSAAKGVTGYEPEDFVRGGLEWANSLIHPDDINNVKQSYKIALQKQEPRVRELSVEYRFNTKHRGYRWIRENRALLFDADGLPAAIIATARDVTDQKAFEAKLHLQKTLLQSQTEASTDGIFAVDLTGMTISYNRRFVEMWGLTDDEVSGKTIIHVRDTLVARVVDHDHFVARFRDLATDIEKTIQDETVLRNGSVFEVYSVPIKDENGIFFGRVTYFRDVTDSRKVEQELRKSEDRYRDIVENSQEFICTHDLRGNILTFNKKVREAFGLTENAEHPTNLIDVLLPSTREGFQEYLDEISEKGIATGLMYVITKNGELRILEYNNTLRTEGVAEPIVRGIAIDVTERKRAEDSVRESEARFRNLADSAPVWIWIAGTDRRLTYANKTFLDFTGNDFEFEVTDGWRNIHPDDLPEARRIYYDAFERKAEYSLAYRHRRRDGEYRWVLLIGVPRWTPSGTFIGYIGSGIDIHERRNAEESLRHTEEKLRQSQKLESVGRLAGGIAHDFNNMLTAIIGYSDITLIKLSAEDPLRRNIEEIRRAAERSASLTSQLLAFSRQQVLQPKIVAFNELVGETIKMLRRLISEHINVEVSLAQEVGFIEADPAQITQVLVNLAVNARDAMPSGGTLSIITRKHKYTDDLPISGELVRDGHVVQLTVRDTGDGIDPEHIPFVFEPFFTTKEVGKGTGLGLATVYGIVKQSSGEIFVESSPGDGTTFNIYFPCVSVDADSLPNPDASRVAPSRGSERILIVEDEAMVRELAKTLLEEEGYEVMTAVNGSEALELGREIGGSIDLVITDLVMPEMSGIEFARHLKKIHPNIPILFTSGYTEDKSFLDEIREDKVDFLSKPFVVEALVAKVREFIDSCRK